MYCIDLKGFFNEDNSNKGISKEWALCRYFGIERTSHDKTAYDEGSDIELPNGRNISVKSSNFTLMSGKKSLGCKTFEGIWRRYYKKCHSNEWAYITKEWKCYFMNKKEFSKMIHKFGRLGHESSSKGGDLKLRVLPESGFLRQWLEKMCA